MFDDGSLQRLLKHVEHVGFGLTMELLARSLHGASAVLVKRIIHNIPPQQRNSFLQALLHPASLSEIAHARKQVLDAVFWELTYWKTPDLYEELTEGEQLHPGIFQQLEPDIRGKTVLDMGAGSGRATFECVRYGARLVYAVDPSPGLLHILEQKLVGGGEHMSKRSGAGSVCRSEAGQGAYVAAQRSGADIASGAGDRAMRSEGQAKQGLQQTPLSPAHRIITYTGYFDAIPLKDSSVHLALSCSAFTALPEQGGEPGLAEMQRVTKPGGKIVLIWPRREDYDWLAAHGFHYVALPMQEEMCVRFRSLQSAIRCARRFYACNAAVLHYILTTQRPEVPFSVLGVNPPCDYCWLEVS